MFLFSFKATTTKSDNTQRVETKFESAKCTKITITKSNDPKIRVRGYQKETNKTCDILNYLNIYIPQIFNETM